MLMEKPVYLDYNATTPIAPEVAEAILPCLGPLFGNPSSPHAYGIEARQAVEKARGQVTALLGCSSKEIIFTSNGTEANNMALFGVAEACAGQGRQIITSAIEHPAILEPCKELARRGYEITIVPVDKHGLVNPSDVAEVLRPDTLLVSIMHANNEVGTIQAIAEIAAFAHAHGALVHTDAAQSTGKVPVNVDELGVDLLTIAGHKLYAPKGVGALYVRQGVCLAPFLRGGGQEGGRRASTENVLGIVGLGAACALIAEHLDEYAAHMRAMRDRLREGLERAIGDIRFNGHPTLCLPNTLSVSFRGLNATDILVELADAVAASAGAACHANEVSISPVLGAMGVPLDYARGTLRLSVGRTTTAAECDLAVGAIQRVVSSLRAAG